MAPSIVIVPYYYDTPEPPIMGSDSIIPNSAHDYGHQDPTSAVGALAEEPAHEILLYYYYYYWYNITLPCLG